MIDFRVELNKQENPKAKIWRYMDFTKFVSLLEKKKLFFAQQSELEDKYEGRVPEKRLNELISRARDLANREHLDQFAKDHFKAATECIERTYSLMDDIRYSMYVCSWYQNDYESHAMWKLYLNSNEGIAIQSTYEKLFESFSGKEAIVFGSVQYVDYDSSEPINTDSLLRHSFIKRPYFEYEKELRVAYTPLNQGIVNQPLSGVIDFIKNNSTDMGLYIQADINKLIENIYVAPGAPAWFNDLAESIIEKYDYKLNVIKSSLDKSPMNNILG